LSAPADIVFLFRFAARYIRTCHQPALYSRVLAEPGRRPDHEKQWNLEKLILKPGRRENSMSILGNIISTIFGHAGAAPAPAGAAPGASPASAGSSASAAPKPASAPGAAPAATVDVAAILTKLAANNKEKLDWQKSIVDLMKLLNLDSSLAARKELAHELHYSGDTNDSASMNIWLHKQVMQKLAENGGKVPDELRK
jgi:Domain of unknown function (DUF3597)